MATLLITHNHAEGTTLAGSRKGDGVYEILRSVAGMNWRFHRDAGLYVRGSRDKDANRSGIDRTRTALESAGHTVTVETDDTARPIAEVRADQAARADDKADRLTDRAGRAAGESAARWEAEDSILNKIPAGQPILADHHSARGHRAALDRAESHRRKGSEAAAKAGQLAERADGVRAHAAHRDDPRAMMRRIETLAAEVRGHERERDGYVREFKRNDGSVYARDESPAATGGRAEQLATWIDRANEEIAYLRGQLAEMDTAGTFTAWTPEDFQKGDYARVRGDWYQVARVNRKSVSVVNRFHGDAGRATPVTFDEISGRRRDGQQWDTPAGEPWPVELAREVAGWALLARSADGDHTYGSDMWREAMNARHAARLVHGLPIDASRAQLATVADSITGTDERRQLAAAYLAVFDRLTAGELVPDIAASLTPITGAPAWSFPADAETVMTRAAQSWPTTDRPVLAVGDLVAGMYDRGAETPLLKHFVGPVAAISAVKQRHERGDWVTITLTDGDSREVKTGQWFAVYPAGTWETSDQAEPEPTADELRAAAANDQRNAHASVLDGIAAGSSQDAEQLRSVAATAGPADCGLIAGKYVTGEALSAACLAEAEEFDKQAAAVRAAAAEERAKIDAGVLVLPDVTGGKAWCVTMQSGDSYHVRLSGHHNGEFIGYHLLSGDDVRLTVADVTDIQPWQRDCNHTVSNATVLVYTPPRGGDDDPTEPVKRWHIRLDSDDFARPLAEDIAATLPELDDRETWVEIMLDAAPGRRPAKRGAIVRKSLCDAGGVVQARTGSYVLHNGRRLAIEFAHDRDTRDMLWWFIDGVMVREMPGGLAELTAPTTLDALCTYADQPMVTDVHRAHPVTSGPFCIAYDNHTDNPAGSRSTFVRADVTCPGCVATYKPGGDDPRALQDAAGPVSPSPWGALTVGGAQ